LSITLSISSSVISRSFPDQWEWEATSSQKWIVLKFES
jgi:hypothetical protein